MKNPKFWLLAAFLESWTYFFDKVNLSDPCFCTNLFVLRKDWIPWAMHLRTWLWRYSYLPRTKENGQVDNMWQMVQLGWLQRAHFASSVMPYLAVFLGVAKVLDVAPMLWFCRENCLPRYITVYIIFPINPDSLHILPNSFCSVLLFLIFIH